MWLHNWKYLQLRVRKYFVSPTWRELISARSGESMLSCVKLENVKWRHCIVLGNKKIVGLKQWNHETRSSIWSSAPSPTQPSSLHGCKKEISVEGKQMGKDIRLSPHWIVSRDTWQIVRTFQLVVLNIQTVNLNITGTTFLESNFQVSTSGLVTITVFSAFIRIESRAWAT